MNNIEQVVSLVDIDLRKRWIEALRSGKYNQGRHSLRAVRRPQRQSDPDTFCCLGVLCDVADPERWEDEKFLGPAGRTIMTYRGPDEDGRIRAFSAQPPDDVITEAGLSIDDIMTLQTMNDSQSYDGGRSFLQIADWLEKGD